jgi:hypothetical protein
VGLKHRETKIIPQLGQKKSTVVSALRCQQKVIPSWVQKTNPRKGAKKELNTLLLV